jgi:hypothetical protein
MAKIDSIASEVFASDLFDIGVVEVIHRRQKPTLHNTKCSEVNPETTVLFPVPRMQTLSLHSTYMCIPVPW